MRIYTNFGRQLGQEHHLLWSTRIFRVRPFVSSTTCLTLFKLIFANKVKQVRQCRAIFRLKFIIGFRRQLRREHYLLWSSRILVSPRIKHHVFKFV